MCFTSKIAYGIRIVSPNCFLTGLRLRLLSHVLNTPRLDLSSSSSGPWCLSISLCISSSNLSFQTAVFLGTKWLNMSEARAISFYSPVPSCQPALESLLCWQTAGHLQRFTRLCKMLDFMLWMHLWPQEVFILSRE